MTRIELRDRVVDFLTLGEYGFEPSQAPSGMGDGRSSRSPVQPAEPFDWSRERDRFPARPPAFVGRGRGVELQREVEA